MKLETKLLFLIVLISICLGISLYFNLKPKPIEKPQIIKDTTYISKPDTIIIIKHKTTDKPIYTIVKDTIIIHNNSNEQVKLDSSYLSVKTFIDSLYTAKVEALAKCPIEVLKLNIRLKNIEKTNFTEHTDYWYWYVGGGIALGTITTLLIINNIRR